MLTKIQEKNLEEALKAFIGTQFDYYMQGTEKIYLVYDEKSKEFDVSPIECYGDVYILDRPVMDWRETLNRKLEEEVKAIIANPARAEYDYPQEIIDSVKVLVFKNAGYNISCESDKILEESGAANVIKEENTRYYTEVDTSYFEELKEEAIEAYEALQKDGAIEPYDEEMEKRRLAMEEHRLAVEKAVENTGEENKAIFEAVKELTHVQKKNPKGDFYLRYSPKENKFFIRLYDDDDFLNGYHDNENDVYIANISYRELCKEIEHSREPYDDNFISFALLSEAEKHYKEYKIKKFEKQEKEKPSIKAKIKEYQEKESIKAKDKPLKQAKHEKEQEL